jgi:hypothetical protein
MPLARRRGNRPEFTSSRDDSSTRPKKGVNHERAGGGPFDMDADTICVLNRGSAEHFMRQTIGGDNAAVQQQVTVGEATGEPNIVKRRRVTILRLIVAAHQFHYLQLSAEVEGAGGLDEKKQLRITDQSLRGRNQLLLAT